MSATRSGGVLTRTSSTAAQTRAVAAVVADLLEPGDVLLLVGGLGAGKTEFTKGLAAGLGVREPVVSPTFTLVRAYEGRLPLVHVDVYRLDRGTDVLDLGLEDLAGDDGVVVVEWGDLAAGFVPGEHLEVRLEPVPDGDPDERRVTMTPLGGRWHERLGALDAALPAPPGGAA